MSTVFPHLNAIHSCIIACMNIIMKNELFILICKIHFRSSGTALYIYHIRLCFFIISLVFITAVQLEIRYLTCNYLLVNSSDTTKYTGLWVLVELGSVRGLVFWRFGRFEVLEFLEIRF